MRRIEIYDTTLRDGAQGEGISFSLRQAADRPSGWIAWGSTTSRGAIRPPTTRTSNISSAVAPRAAATPGSAAFGMTRRKGVAADEDQGLAAARWMPRPR